MGNVGQGNLLALKCGDHALVVDCGRHRTTTKYAQLQEPIKTFLSGANVTFVITHKHYDHYSFLQKIVEWDTHKTTSIYYGDYGKGAAIPLPKSILAQKINSISDIPTGIDIGPMHVDFVLPTTWPQKKQKNGRKKRSDDPNDNSLVLTVTCGPHKVLFTGDASGATLDAIQQVPDNLRKLQNVTCIVVPHHGSNLSGEFAWFYFTKDNITEDFCFPYILSLISSDPAEADFLPWYGTSKFICSRRGVEIKVPEHKIGTANGIQTTTQPLFLSSNALSGYWTVVFSTEGEQQVFDGDPSGLNWMVENSDGELVDPEIEEIRRKWPLSAILATPPSSVSVMTDIINNCNVLFKKEDIMGLGNFLIESYLASTLDSFMFSAIIGSCIENMDLLFSGDLRSVFINFITGLLNKPNILKQCIDNFDIFSEDEQQVVVGALDTFLQNSPQNFTLYGILDSCMRNSYLMENQSFTDLLIGAAKEGKINLTDDQLLECIEESGSFSLDSRSNLADYILSHLGKELLTLEDWQDFMIAATRYLPNKAFLDDLLGLMPGETE